jgi:hypothetical protein
MSDSLQPHGWTRLVLDGYVGRGETILYGLVIRCSETGSQVLIYDGQDASGRLVGTFEAEADVSRSISFEGGLRLDHGIYADLGTNVDEVLLIWDAVPGSSLV